MAHPVKIAIVGAGGHVGGAFAKELVRTGRHQITAISREGSKSEIPEGIEVVHVDYSDEDSVVAALKGHDVLIITLSVHAPAETHSELVRAAGKARIPFVFPNVYGSDIANDRLADERTGDLYAQTSRDKCKEIQQAGSAYIACVCGFWFEWSLARGESQLGIDIANRTVTFFDNGETKIDLSTAAQCGRAMTALLSLPLSGASPSVADWKNSLLYFHSFCVSQRDILNSLHRVLGTTDQDWTIHHVKSEDRYAEARSMLENGDRTGLVQGMYTRIFYPNGDGNFGSKHKLTNEVLGLPQESLDEAVKQAVSLVDSDWATIHDD